MHMHMHIYGDDGDDGCGDGSDGEDGGDDGSGDGGGDDDGDGHSGGDYVERLSCLTGHQLEVDYDADDDED